MKKFPLAILGLILGITSALSQTSPNLITGQVPTAAQWNSYFAAKTDYPGYKSPNKNGDVMLGLLRFSMPVPTLTSCGTGPSVRGNNQVFEVTMGTGNPTGCIITFETSHPYTAVPSCNITWQTQLASMNYTVSQTSVTITQTATSSNKINGTCTGLQ